MEGLIGLLILFWIMKAVVGKSKRVAGTARHTKKKPLHEESLSAAAHRAERAARIQEEIQRRQHKRAAEAAHAKPEPRQTVMDEATSEGFSAYRPLQHRMAQVSSHMDYEGSLGGGSTEGVDTCDPELEHGVHWQPEADSVYAREIGSETLIDLSPRAMMQGVVMSEILTRPARRVRR